MAITVLPAVEVAKQLNEAYGQRDWRAVRGCYHDEALLATMATHSVPTGADATLELLRRYASDTLFEVSTEIRFERLDDTACIVDARARYPRQAGGFADSRLFWLMTFKDGLLYRMRVCASRSEAADSYVNSGLTLGF